MEKIVGLCKIKVLTSAPDRDKVTSHVYFMPAAKAGTRDSKTLSSAVRGFFMPFYSLILVLPP